MKRNIVLFISFFLSLQIFGKEITIDKAKEVAVNFLHQTDGSNLKSVSPIDMVYLGDITDQNLQKPNSLKSTSIESPELYFFSFDNSEGFIIVSGDDVTIPILGYSNNTKINTTNLPSNFRKWIEGYKQQINFLRANSIGQTEDIKMLWDGKTNNLKSTQQTVSPLISTQWNQAPYVNDKCPFDEDENELTVTGCPATAMAQIMKFWKYPAQGIGFHSYQHDKYGTLSANFGSTTYNWNAMPNVINAPNDDVALLMYHCGVAVEMNYNVASQGGSGSYVIIDPLERYPQTQTVEYALKTYFGYDPSIKGLERASYSDTEWKNILKTELDAGRPIQYAGFGKGGHTFVCDGYDQNNYFHINWGWGGSWDAFFLLDALNPGSGGTGGGGYSYNDGQQALIGIKPGNSEDPVNPIQTVDLQIYGDVKTDNSTINYGDAFSVQTQISNIGTTPFTGEFCAAIFDKDDAFIDFVETISGTLESGYYYDFTFSNAGSLTLLPGSYYIYIFARPTDGEWFFLSPDPDDYFTQGSTEISVEYTNKISLYSTIDVLTDDVYSKGPLSVWLDIVNNSVKDFSGIFDVSLYDLDGEFVTTVEEKTDMMLNADYHYINGLTFSTNNLNVEPGTYLLALMHQWKGKDYELTGATSTYINPIKIIVQGSPLVKDIYEDNDSFEEAYSLKPNFQNNAAHLLTTGSNVHVGSDWDFYSVNLESGFNYTVNARLHDAYSSSDGNSYSVDGLFLYSTDNGENWSDVFDDVMPGDITVSGDKSLCFVVSPYFLGETGTYLFDISLNRSKGNSIETNEISQTLSVYPNPFTNKITISNFEDVVQFKLFDIQGKLLRYEPINNKIQIVDLSALKAGVYILEVEGKKNIYKEKIIKQ
jgi:hypothetical protein